jgi:hypothetical protein
MITDEQIDQIKSELLGTCQSLIYVLEKLDIDASLEEAEDRLLDGDSVELCMVCNWWHESCCLEYSDELGGGICDQCQEEEC